MDLQPIRREVDSDNSCLFSSIAYLINKQNFDDSSSLKFRNIIVEYLLDNEFDSSLLDQPKDQYIDFIQDTKNWGGALEVKMFSEIFKIKIICIDVKTNITYIYGEDKNYDYCIYLLYNGAHYDPLVMNIDITSDPISDITIFDSNDNNILELMKSLVLEYKNQGECIDFYTIKCNDCNQKFTSENDAYNHLINYNHTNLFQI
jgi:ubiquitin thioesterase OTU1